jgi:hypothetical protein
VQRKVFSYIPIFADDFIIYLEESETTESAPAEESGAPAEESEVKGIYIIIIYNKHIPI